MSNEQENEQEFDAESLAALARSSIAGPPPTKSVPPAGGVKDDSGLINLKALAEQASSEPADEPVVATATNGKSAPPSARASTRPISAGPAASPAAMASPVVAAPQPAAPAQARSNALIYVLGAVAVAAIVAFVYVNKTRTQTPEPTSTDPTAESENPAATDVQDPPSAPNEPTQVAENTPPPAADPSPAAPAPEATPPAAPEATATPATPADPTATGDERDRDRERDRERDRDRERERAAAAGATGGAATPPTPTPAAAAPTPPTPASPTPAATGGSDPTPAGARAATKRGMDELLDRALGGGPAAGGVGTRESPRSQPEEGGGADIPDVPPRGAITSALGRLRRSVENCANGAVGVARAQVTFGSDGNVSDVSIQGAPFAGTPAGTCMERVIRRARVPRFRRSSLSITYPFSVRPPE